MVKVLHCYTENGWQPRATRLLSKKCLSSMSRLKGQEEQQILESRKALIQAQLEPAIEDLSAGIPPFAAVYYACLCLRETCVNSSESTSGLLLGASFPLWGCWGGRVSTLLPLVPQICVRTAVDCDLLAASRWRQRLILWETSR